MSKEEGKEAMNHGARVLLRAITPGDLPVLLKWRNDDAFAKFCTRRRTKLATTEELDRELCRDFANDRHRQMLIIASRTGRAIGTIYSYKYDRCDGHLFVTIFLENPRYDKGLGAIACALFCRDLFEELDLFKIYMEVYEYNESVVASLKKAGLREEGRFQGHRKYGGTRYDMLRFAMYRETIERSFISRKR